MMAYHPPRTSSLAVSFSLATKRVHCFSPFRYPGGKTWLTPFVVRWLSPKVDYIVEPFTGGGNVSIAAISFNLAEKAFLAEKDPNVSAVWKVMLNGCCGQLVDRVKAFNLTRKTVESVLNSPAKTTLDLAFKTIIRNRVSHGGVMAKGAGLLKNGEDGHGLSSRWYPETLSSRIAHINSLKKRFSFCEANGVNLLKVFAEIGIEGDAAFFIDPPYSVAGRRLRRLYHYHEVDHAELFRIAATLPGRILMTYDNSAYIKRLARESNFLVRSIPMRSVHHVEKHELLISKAFDWLDHG